MSCYFTSYYIVYEAGGLEKKFFQASTFLIHVSQSSPTHVQYDKKTVFKAGVYAFPTWSSEICLRCYYATQFYFPSICTFRCFPLLLRLLEVAAARQRQGAPHMQVSSWKSPGAETSALLTLSYLEHRFALLVTFWHL